MKLEQKKCPCLSVLGTASDVGKSIVVTALCRIFNDLGVAVTPFKAQNMSNNSYVTEDQKEMGRAQVVQAEAARLAPHVDMNPVLLKPNSDMRAQVVLNGLPFGNESAKSYGRLTDYLHDQSVQSLNRLRGQYQLVVMEGAGSCAEMNLKNRDYVNFPMAVAGEAPVILVADIDRGGVFAQLVGTLAVLPPKERDRIKGFIINRFRGDVSLFSEGKQFIEKQTGLPVLGIVPYLHNLNIESEDAVVLDGAGQMEKSSGEQLGLENGGFDTAQKVSIGVIKLPHISNFTDFDPLQKMPMVNLTYLTSPGSISAHDFIILPGTKNARGDMVWLQKTGFAKAVKQYVAGGGRVGGICGGYQLLGQKIADPKGIEGPPGETTCLGILPVSTTLNAQKHLAYTTGTWTLNNTEVTGYEIHQGQTVQEAGAPVLDNASSNHPTVDRGAVSGDHAVWGTYIHGLFDEPKFRAAFVKSLRPDILFAEDAFNLETNAYIKNNAYNRLAREFASVVDIQKIGALAGLKL